MRKFIVLAILSVSTIAGYSQNVDNFEVGPYEVDYKGEGDFKSRLRPDIDLYEYFGLKRDTVIVVSEALSPVTQAIQVNGFMSMPRFPEEGCANLFGVNGSWKRKVGNMVYFNAGLSVGVSYGIYNAMYADTNKVVFNIGKPGLLGVAFSSLKKMRFVMLEVGMPLSVEFTNLDREKASLYASIGVTPIWYSTLEKEILESIRLPEMIEGSENEFLVAPRIDFGGYVPVGNRIMRMGIYAEYKIHCFGDEPIYNKMDQLFVGANIGVVF